MTRKSYLAIYVSKRKMPDTKPPDPGGCFLSSFSDRAAFCVPDYQRQYFEEVI